MRNNLHFALIGWLGGLTALLILGLSWSTIFPAIINTNHYYGAGPNLPTIMAINLLLVTPVGLIGGIVGSRLPKEGGKRGQQILAFAIGIVFSAPFFCYGLWFFTGY